MSSSVGRPLGGGRSRSRAGRGAEAAGRRGASLGTSAARRGGPDCLIDYFPVKDILGGGVTWPRDVGRPAVKSRKTRSAAAPSTKSRGRTAPFRSVPFRSARPPRRGRRARCGARSAGSHGAALPRRFSARSRGCSGFSNSGGGERSFRGGH